MDWMISPDQKEVLYREISEYCRQHNVRSLLDIGAGDGALAERLSRDVPLYQAIEARTENVTQLRSLDISVKEETFPDTTIAQQFDLVLSSHSLPEDVESMPRFLKAAWELVDAGGSFLVVTFKGGCGGVIQLRNAWHESERVWDEDLYLVMKKTLESLGALRLWQATSVVKSNDIDEVIPIALGTVAPRPEQKDACVAFLKEKLDAEYREGDSYALPFEHVFISVEK